MFTVLIFAIALLVGCTDGKRDAVSGTAGQYAFTDDIRLKTTPVKDQQNAELGWAYAMLATIETERLMQGDSVNLSPIYSVRRYIEEQAMDCYLRNTKAGISLRGFPSMLLAHLQQYGAMSFDAYRTYESTDFGYVCNKVEQMADVRRLHRDGLDAANRAVADYLDDVIGPAPRYVFMYGCEYTVQEFAHSVCRSDEYVGITSFTHHPAGEWFSLEVEGNKYRDRLYNVSLDRLVSLVNASISSGHPVCWAGDVSEKGFCFADGVAVADDEKRQYTQHDRQKDFEYRHTTDDHCMAIVGMAHDKNGRRYYICKNSWGSNNRYGGMMYMSENYFRMKTIAIFMQRERVFM